MTNEVNVALAQINCKVGDKKYNIDKMVKHIKRAKKKDANLIIFPELSLTGYIVRDLAYELAESIRGPSSRLLEEAAKKEKVYIVFGMIERSEKAHAVIYNTAVLVGPEGFVGKYQKMHLPTHSVFEEKRYFRPGYQAPVFDTDIGKVGLMVCYDILFPEVARMLRLNGSQLTICISASPAVRRKFFEVLTVARAMENTTYLGFVNLVGMENGLQFWGGSRLIAPNGSIISQAKYDEEDQVIGRVDYANLKRTETFVPTLRDLRPEFFETLKRQAENL